GAAAAWPAGRRALGRDGPRPAGGPGRRRPGAGGDDHVDVSFHGPAVRRRRSGSRGQAAVEVVAMVPLLFLVALAVSQVLVAGLAREAAHQAAQAGAMALLQGGDPVREARAAAPGWSRRRLAVVVSGRT